jgi:hypothetical protein
LNSRASPSQAAELARRIDPEGFTPEMLQAQIDSSEKQRAQTIRRMRALGLSVHSDYDDEMRQ